jgi:LemA protein
MLGILILVVILVVVAIAIIAWYIATGNNLKLQKLKVEESQSGIEIALTKRYDTLLKMRDVVKSYATHERDTLTETIAMRKGMSLEEMKNATRQIDQMRAKLEVIIEQYPQLRSIELFVNLHETILVTEGHLQAARRLYNSNVTMYNASLVMFPSSIVANALKMVPAEYFEAEEEKKQDVSMVM